MMYHSVGVGEVEVEVEVEVEARIGVGLVAVGGVVEDVLFVNEEHYYCKI
jgi:hypothetical protein